MLKIRAHNKLQFFFILDRTLSAAVLYMLINFIVTNLSINRTKDTRIFMMLRSKQPLHQGVCFQQTPYFRSLVGLVA